MLTASLGLHQSALNNLERQTIALDIHLSGGQTVLRTSGLEVHITQVILVAENIRKDGELVLTRVVDETHGNTCHRILDGHTGVHQGESTAADAGH